MEALSSPASSLKAAATTPFLSAATHLNQLPLHPPRSAPLPVPNLSATGTLKPQSHHYLTKFPLRISSPPRPRPSHLDVPPRRTTYRSASTGYAAALVDAARCDGVLGAAERDARRLLHGIRGVLVDQALDERTKGKVVRGVAEGGGFYRHLVSLVRMLVAKGRVGLVEEVMEEFGRICDGLSGTRAVVVSSKGDMEDERLLEIARKVQKASGAPRVRVRHVRMLAA
ncbi:hypothetical protein Cni_G21888 [Canna indica]|uniref:Uncharacterized protein n=1 Tax=Canna indica TaxID=4628 RepID=A0AAQ3KQU9_9LILI|nr:hypothetical protein Cni_G21888 [Canna indica]